MKKQSRGAPSPSFAALRELARVYKVFLKQSLFVWPSRYGSSFVIDSALDGFWSRARLSEIFDQCIHELQAQLGPAYQSLFSSDGRGAVDERDGTIEPVAFREITATLDDEAPEWSHEFILDRQPALCSPLFQIHNAVDEHGQRWQIKVIKASARERLDSTLYALREIEATLRPLRGAKVAADLLAQVEELRRSLQRAANLNNERRVLQRLKNKVDGDKRITLRFPKVHHRFGSESVLIYEALEGQALSLETFDPEQLDAKSKLSLARQPLQASVLKAFEIGLIRKLSDTQKLVVMKDGAIGVRQGWATLVSDGKDRGQAANLLRALYVNDFSHVNDVLATGSLRAPKSRKSHGTDGPWQQKMKDLAKGSQSYSLVELAEVTFHYTKSLGIELPTGFVDTAKSLQSLEGIGKPLVATRMSTAFWGVTGRSVVAHEFTLNSQIPRARRLHRR